MLIVWNFILKLFFRDIQIIGRHKVPDNHPILFTSNHTNSLIDPFVISVALQRHIKMTAKSALLKNPFLRILCTGLEVITFNRTQDSEAGSDMRQNAEAIKDCQKELAGGASICIFPEGKSHTEPKMLPFKSGAARIALGYEKSYPDKPSLKIVPIGLFYERKYKFRSRVVVQVGDAIDIKKWKEQNTSGEYKELTDTIENEVKKIVLEFERTRDSILILWASELFQKNRIEPGPIGHPDSLPEEYLNITQYFVKEYYRLKDTPEIKQLEHKVYNFRKEQIQKGIEIDEIYLPISFWKSTFFMFREAELFLLGMPLFILGFLGHIVPFISLIIIVKIMSKDQDHWATNYLFVGTGLFFCYYVFLIILFFLVKPILILIPIFILPYSGYFLILYSQRINQIFRRIRTFFAFLFNPKLQLFLQKESDDIVELINVIKEKYKTGEAGVDT